MEPTLEACGICFRLAILKVADAGGPRGPQSGPADNAGDHWGSPNLNREMSEDINDLLKYRASGSICLEHIVFAASCCGLQVEDTKLVASASSDGGVVLAFRATRMLAADRGWYCFRIDLEAPNGPVVAYEQGRELPWRCGCGMCTGAK